MLYGEVSDLAHSKYTKMDSITGNSNWQVKLVGEPDLSGVSVLRAIVGRPADRKKSEIKLKSDSNLNIIV